MKLEQAMRKLKEISRHSLAEYSGNEALKDRAERNFQVAAQACIDVANHIVAARGLRTPEGYGDSFVVLSEEGIIPAEVAFKMKAVAGFRNVLVHDYLEINVRTVYENLQKLEDLAEFAEHIGRLLDNPGGIQ
jgi:uncharacterized protein YutE (UPF0331/DUF86 family)